MARYNGLIIPRSYNDYFSRSDPQAIRAIVLLTADGELNAESKNPLQNQAIAKIVPVTASPENKLLVQSQISGLIADVETIKNIIPNTALAGYVRCFDSVPGNDWNNALEEGTYNIAYDNVAKNIKNNPSNYAVKVIVKKADANDPWYIYQTAYTCEFSIRIRVQKKDNIWTEWKDLIKF